MYGVGFADSPASSINQSLGRAYLRICIQMGKFCRPTEGMETAIVRRDCP